MGEFGLVLTTALVTAAAVIIGLNFITAERRLIRLPPRWRGREQVDFRRSTGVLLGPAIMRGNAVSILLNGDNAFPAMLKAVEEARASICFETFIYWSGDIGQQFADRLCAAAKRGVPVHVLLDWVGSRRMDPRLIRQLGTSGCEVQFYHPPSWYHIARINNRTHRKLLIVDGRVGFTGGMGIAEQWTGNAENARHWRDTHFEARGPVVAQMQAVFLDNWIKITGQVLHGESYFPALPETGDLSAQMFGSSTSSGSDSMHLLVLLAITSARKTIDIGNAYFVPDRLTLSALLEARTRGVRVRVLVPGHYIDVRTVRYASRSVWTQLLAAGVEIFEYMPTMYHCKILIVDSLWTSVGSANFDTRSFRLNDEANLNVFGEGFAGTLVEQYEQDLSRSRRIRKWKWLRRSRGGRFLEAIASLFRSQL